MKKMLMAAAILAVGAVAYGNVSAPVNVSLDVITTSNLVLMDGATQLTQIDLEHPQILLSSVKGITSPSVVSKTFKAQTGDNSIIQVGGVEGGKIDYVINGVGAAGELVLSSGQNISGKKTTINSTLTLSRDSDIIVAKETGAVPNIITSTIPSSELNALEVTGTYTGAAALNVILSPVTP